MPTAGVVLLGLRSCTRALDFEGLRMRAWGLGLRLVEVPRRGLGSRSASLRTGRCKDLGSEESREVRVQGRKVEGIGTTATTTTTTTTNP